MIARSIGRTAPGRGALGIGALGIGALGIWAMAALPAAGQEMTETETMKTWEAAGAFEDVTLYLKLAVEGRGLVVDHVSHVGEMLARTAGDVGAEAPIFEAAQVIQFCSATVSRRMMAADPANLAWCPYGIFAYQLPGADTVTVGFRRMPEGEMQEVETLLQEIVEEAVGF